MSSVTETYESRIGALAGFGPVQDQKRDFDVKLDSSTQDPITVCSAAIPPNSAYPSALITVYAHHYEVIDRKGSLWYVVRVVYRPQDSLLEAGWKWETRFNAESQRLLVTRDRNPALRKLIGPKAYRPTLEFPDDNTGVPFFEPATHRCVSPWSGTIDLKQLDFRKVIGIDVPAGGGIMTFTNNFAAINPAIIFPLLAMRWHVNSGRFFNFTGEPGSVLFTNAQVKTADGIVTGTPQPPVGTPISVMLEFNVNPDRHTPVKFTHTYADDEGNEIPVYAIGETESVVEDFETHYYADLPSAFNLFGP